PVPPPAEPPKPDTNHYVEVKAPIVGTFYAAPSPDAPPFVKEGDRVQKGQVLCIIEAMKLMNEIESEVSGTVKQLLVRNGEPVEYGQALFLIDPA
ncbi:MAG: acetyl-CoA carboxylase biotin carboxyl carrier protein, partial [Thermaceae bacterium]|nr:acetyl-CoA carboxylase biotin carboxyl carrier protein [Thermaceae bacterium]